MLTTHSPDSTQTENESVCVSEYANRFTMPTSAQIYVYTTNSILKVCAGLCFSHFQSANSKVSVHATKMLKHVELFLVLRAWPEKPAKVLVAKTYSFRL